MTILIYLWIGLSLGNDSLIGTWTCYELEDLLEGEFLLIPGGVRDDECTFEVSFKRLGFAYDHHREKYFTYNLEDSILRLGDRLYIVERLRNDTLIFRTHDEHDLNQYRYHLSRLEQ